MRARTSEFWKATGVFVSLFAIFSIASNFTTAADIHFDCFKIQRAANQPCVGVSDCSGCYDTGDPDPNWEPTNGHCNPNGANFTWLLLDECVSDEEKDDGVCGSVSTECWAPFAACALQPQMNYYRCIDTGDWPGPEIPGFPGRGEGGCLPDPQAASCTECRPILWGATVYVPSGVCQ